MLELQVLGKAERVDSFEDMCEALLGYFSEEKKPLKAVTFIQNWLNDGLIVGLATEVSLPRISERD